MNKRNAKKAASLALLCGVLSAGLAEAGPPPGRPAFVPIMTRLMKVLGDQEKALQQAIAQGRRAGVEALLVDDFQEQVGAEKVVTTPYGEWIDAALKHPQPLAGDALEVISAREFGDFAALSFRYVGKTSEGKTKGRFVVDMWKNIGQDRWKLVARYSGLPVDSPASASPVPTGKE
jgi:hypothetical protein